jgi:hypothetical protein
MNSLSARVQAISTTQKCNIGAIGIFYRNVYNDLQQQTVICYGEQ